MKKIVSLLLSGVMIVSLLPLGTDAHAYAAGNATDVVATPLMIKGDPIPSGGSVVDPSNTALESAIKAVKAKITIPAEYSDFNYYFYDTTSYSDSYWSLTWKNPKDSSNIQVNCDKDNHITYFTKYDNSQKNDSMPVYLKDELKSTADKFILQIAPEISYKLQYIDATYDGIYSGNYVYHYQRVENGISLPENTVDVSVNSVTGEVKSTSILWLYKVAIPSSDTKISKDEATKIIKNNLKMKLQYRSDYYTIYARVLSNPKSAFLVYVPDQGYISVDAKTGKVYNDKSEWIENESSYATYNKTAMDTAAGVATETPSQLTDAEIAKVEELKSLISKDAAIKAVTGNKYLYLEKTLTSYSATLNKSYDYHGGSDQYIWNIQLSDPRKVDYNKSTDTYRAYATAQVDAKTGKILGFYASIKNYYDVKTGKWTTVKIPYDKAKSQANLEAFLKSQAGSRFKNSKLVNIGSDYIAYYKSNNTPVYGGYTYQYNRTNEGIEYPNNNIYGAVEGITGKIYNFSMNWDDGITFESSKGSMTADKAKDAYLSKDGYGLVYEINQVNTVTKDSKSQGININNGNYKVDYEVRLVYRPDVNPSNISPFTGEQLSDNGEVYKEAQPYVYKDIENTPANKEILLLADMNIGFEGDYFYPDKPITQGELNVLMQKVGYGYITQDTSSSDKLITREEVAKDLITLLGLNKVSVLKDIYKTGYSDESSIDSNYLGAVALAKAFGLMQADANNNFNPKANVTRADAVHIILSYIKVQQVGVMW